MRLFAKKCLSFVRFGRIFFITSFLEKRTMTVIRTHHHHHFPE
ncbi:hypothetical protein X874_2590 [Mannheimia varigena USDA-ARS-USMARC-1312]|uniref:Uncharacterized protein n=1 Tax=Mannheimia varigena USDA-ARS-USMARC-1296 TaxID=1433287 RepID=W0Q8C8_9PAST|nr:hypothetical protein X808_2490 [Mannheimia varigena USDA-ARS-USMARC-1296]AHG76897.1 hypothetical protein X874_2590 [Mannheimia varigena USDA-ARS-USMARC-1312]